MRLAMCGIREVGKVKKKREFYLTFGKKTVDWILWGQFDTNQ